ncbi:Homoserine O-succinyltransferase [Musa troglodytarum]|uniref:Homoserine O-succinyltransferase n=1 Tax=Musa troglodytarum TaxID=320322 RepID=A0A9E7KZH1_9LILI|nr:Homoserine O-succinyltransferase [Musa troglodytarum]
MGGEDGGEVEKKGRRKFAVLLCADDSDYVKKTYGGYFKVFVGLLGEEGEAWEVYRAAHGELPCMADVDGYDGFVITGSCNDAHGDDQWIKDLVSFLKALDAKKKKILGVCFGHQVWQVPPQAEVMAWSEKTGVEMFRYGDHILGIQGHPEYSKDILRHLLDRLLQRNLIQTCHAEAAKASLDAREPDREAWKRLCKGFLRGNLSWQPAVVPLASTSTP